VARGYDRIGDTFVQWTKGVPDDPPEAETRFRWVLAHT
jgi:hypothetical protein